MLAYGQIGERRVSAERLEKRGGRKQLKPLVVQAQDRRVGRLSLEVRISTNKKRHFERGGLRDLDIENLDRIQAWLLKGHLLGQTPRWRTDYRRPRNDRILHARFSEKRQTHGIVRVKPEMDGLVRQVRSDVKITAKALAERLRTIIVVEIAPTDLAIRQHRVLEVAITQRIHPTGGVVVGQIEQCSDDRFIVVFHVEVRIDVRVVTSRVGQHEVRVRSRRKRCPGTESRTLPR